MAFGLEIRDPIHGFIYREPEERDIVDTALFQRLRKLRQLAMANLVYPGATHTRFDHSLGAFHVAGEIIRRLTESSEVRRLVRYAALLHDVGHGPFSHVGEPILKKYSLKEKLPDDQHKIHELIGQQIILSHPDLDLSKKFRNQIVGLLEGTYGHQFLHDIVSGPMDADKQDYLLRDSYFSGVKYGIYDVERLHNTLQIHDDAEGGDKYLAISYDGIHALEQFVLAKYYMTTQVYRHRIRLITDQMIERAISLGIEKDKLSWLKSLYSYDGSQDYLDEYLTWNDDRLTCQVLDGAEGYAKDIFIRLQRRRLFKCIFDGDQNDFPDPNVRNFVFESSNEFFGAVEKAVAERFDFDVNLVIAYRVKFDSATRTESNVSVIHKTKKPTLFREESTLFKSVDQKIRESRFLVFAPVEYPDDEKRKNKQEREYRLGVTELISELANPQVRLPIPRGEKIMKASDFLIALIDACDGVDGRTLLQKRAYFVSLLSGVSTNLGFDAHYYGPYSSVIDGTVTELVNLGFLRESSTGFGVGQGGFEMRRYCYTLTDDGMELAKRIRGTEDYKKIAENVERIRSAGDPDYVELSIAAKAYFILKRKEKGMSKTDIAKEARRFNWEVSPESIGRAVRFLQQVGLAKPN